MIANFAWIRVIYYSFQIQFRYNGLLFVGKGELDFGLSFICVNQQFVRAEHLDPDHIYAFQLRLQKDNRNIRI